MLALKIKYLCTDMRPLKILFIRFPPFTKRGVLEHVCSDSIKLNMTIEH